MSLLTSSESSEQTIADCQFKLTDECLEQNSEAKSNYDNLYSPTNPPTVQGSEMMLQESTTGTMHVSTQHVELTLQQLVMRLFVRVAIILQE